jgi:heat shock protein HslJ
MMACDEPLMAQDELLAGMLAAGPAIELDGDQLTLETDANTLTLVER